MLLKNYACLGVIFFLVCVRKHKSNLPTNIRTTVGKKTQWYVENANFWVQPNSSLILWQCGVFSFTKVCIFLPMLFIMVFITTVHVSVILQNSGGKNIHTLPRDDLIFPNKGRKFYTGFRVGVKLHN